MPTYEEALKFEEAAPPRTIRLIKASKFFRAYNHSAWLFYEKIAKHKVMRMHLKSLDKDVLYIGFPDSSLFGNIGSRRSAKTEYGFDIMLEESESPDEALYEEWKNTVVTVEASKADFHSLPCTGADAEREVIKRLREFQIENHTMVECVVFLSELRKLVANI